MSKHTKQVTVVIAGLWLILGAITLADAQPAATPAPRPAVMDPAAMPAPRPAPRRVAAKPTARRPAPRPATMVITPARVPVAAMTPAPVAEAPMEAAMTPAAMDAEKPVAMEAVPPKKKESTDKKATFWIGIVSMILMAILLILGAFGLLKWMRNSRAQMILGLIGKGVEAFLRYSKGTKAEWDDAVAKLLNDINDYLMKAGQAPLTAEEKAQAKSMANKHKDITGPDKIPEEKKEEPKKEAKEEKKDDK